VADWTIARPTLDDADEMAAVHVAVWREAYAGLMPADYLASLDVPAFAEHRRDRILHPRPGVDEWLVRDAVGIVALTASGPGRDPDRPVPFELYAINVLARAHGSGVADALLDRVIGDRPAYLWVLDGNDRAQSFYRRHGFADDGGRKPEPATGVVELRMSRGSLPAS
jgi:ribosomal protein S18 acetylase RimI-like enzyme